MSFGLRQSRRRHWARLIRRASSEVEREALISGWVKEREFIRQLDHK